LFTKLTDCEQETRRSVLTVNHNKKK
jgi:hypothetical protein